MTVKVDRDDAAADLLTPIARGRAGEGIVIAIAGEPVARLVPEHGD